MTLPEAIRELRRVANKSQQVVATELGIAVKTLSMYESGQATPEPKNLMALAAYADRLDEDNLYRIFLGDALLQQLVPPPGYRVEIKFEPIPPPRRRKGATKK
jgi:transcriptional regulator with XRE-family HTH domain